ncbi:1-phosphofructokinase [Bacillus sp. FJAT-45037]|uniref:1-phosphofructokinase n=1 Tax=Bacillus sp. FJAT-45037 TaxID=2011007 RepID=UPI000C244912|nr:1-phosphofructokinase [Bacillus sp. FJAT-45037]
MIYTLTLNPSVDYIVSVDGFKLGETNRTTEERKVPGGKGINVSRVLKQLQVESQALGFVGGFTGQFMKASLKQENITADFIEVAGDTRINIKLKTGTETELNGQSPLITMEHLNSLKTKLQKIKDGDFLVLAGSVPKSVPSSIYSTIMREMKGRGVQVIVDSSGPALKEALADQPFLIKPNHHELAELFQYEEVSIEHAVELGKKALDQGAQNVIVSMAGEGALFINNEMTLTATVPKGEVVNSVGAGDSVVAGFLAALKKEQSLEDSFRYAIAAGSATAFKDGFCTVPEIEKLERDIKINKL